jgi:hypothetical protein
VIKINSFFLSSLLRRLRSDFAYFIFLIFYYADASAFAVNSYPKATPYPSAETYNQDFLFEHSPTQIESDSENNDENFRCVEEAAVTLHPGAPYYYIHQDYDIIVTQTKTPGVGAVLFSLRESDQANILPSAGKTDLPLFLKSKIEIMCPAVKTEIHRKSETGVTEYDALLFRY